MVGVINRIAFVREPSRLLGVLLLILTVHTWHDPDIWYHLNLGRAVWAQKAFQPATQFLLEQQGYVNFYWLFQLIVYALYSVGEIFLTHALFIFNWLIVGWLWLKRIDKEYRSQWGFLIGLLSLFTIQTRFSARPDIILFALLFGQVLIFDSAFRKGKLEQKHFALVWLLQVLATNIQTYFIFGIATGFVYFVASSLKRKSLDRSAFGCWIGLILSSFVSPFGWNGWILIFHYARVMDQMKSVLMELQSPMARHFFEWCYWFQLGITLIASVWLLLRQKWTQAYPVMIALFGATLSVLAARNVPFLVLFSAPLWGEVLRLKSPRPMRTASVMLAAVAIAVLCTSVVTNSLYNYMRVTKRFGIGILEDKFPVHAVTWLQAQTRGQVRFFNEPNYGGYLAWRMPDQFWFSDSRYVEPERVLLYFKALNDKPTFDQLNNAYGFQAIILNKVMSGQLAPALWDDPMWKPLYQDADNVILVRRPREAKP